MFENENRYNIESLASTAVFKDRVSGYCGIMVEVTGNQVCRISGLINM